MSFEGKVVLVTGAATGIGAAIAAGFSAQGAHVYGLDVAWQAGGTVGTSGIEQVHCDLADEDMVTGCVADIEASHGAVDILIDNAALAGAVEPKPFEEITRDEWVKVITNNTLAPFLCTRAVVPKMRERKYGRIVKELGDDGINVNGVAPGLTMTQSMKDNSGWTSEIQDRSIQNRIIKREETC